MKCPNCFAEIKYRERSNNQCTKCKGVFVFEPKTHPLSLTDAFFSKTVDKLSANGTIFFTLEQLQFALNRKKFRQTNLFPVFVFLAILTTILTLIFFRQAVVFVATFWLIFLVYKKIYAPKTVEIKQTVSDFYDEVLMPWKRLHNKLPSHLITENVENEDIKNTLRGFLLCDKKSTANFLIANQVEKTFGVVVSVDAEFPKNTSERNLPIFVLHDASFSGYKFVEKIEQIYENEAEVLDIGLRPRDAKQFELEVFRETISTVINVKSLTNEENKWLSNGFYTPIFALNPERLLRLMYERIEPHISEIEK